MGLSHKGTPPPTGKIGVGYLLIDCIILCSYLHLQAVQKTITRRQVYCLPLALLKYTKYPKYIPSTSTGQVLIFKKST